MIIFVVGQIVRNDDVPEDKTKHFLFAARRMGADKVDHHFGHGERIFLAGFLLGGIVRQGRRYHHIVVGRIINYDQFVAEKQTFDDKQIIFENHPGGKFDIVSADEVSLVKFVPAAAVANGNEFVFEFLADLRF